jgi:hypothetical protein
LVLFHKQLDPNLGITIFKLTLVIAIAIAVSINKIVYIPTEQSSVGSYFFGTYLGAILKRLLVMNERSFVIGVRLSVNAIIISAIVCGFKQPAIACQCFHHYRLLFDLG